MRVCADSALGFGRYAPYAQGRIGAAVGVPSGVGGEEAR